MDKFLKVKIILLTIAATLTVEAVVTSVLCGFGVIHVGLGKEKPVSIVVISPTDQTITTTEESTTASTTETTVEEETTTSKKKTTTKKATAATTTTTKNQTGDNDGEWLADWY